MAVSRTLESGSRHVADRVSHEAKLSRELPTKEIKRLEPEATFLDTLASILLGYLQSLRRMSGSRNSV